MTSLNHTQDYFVSSSQRFCMSRRQEDPRGHFVKINTRLSFPISIDLSSSGVPRSHQNTFFSNWNSYSITKRSKLALWQIYYWFLPPLLSSEFDAFLINPFCKFVLAASLFYSWTLGSLQSLKTYNIFLFVCLSVWINNSDSFVILQF